MLSVRLPLWCPSSHSEPEISAISSNDIKVIVLHLTQPYTERANGAECIQEKNGLKS